MFLRLKIGRYSLLALTASVLLLISTTQFSLTRHIGKILRPTSAPIRSAWFSEGGFLRFNNTDGLKTVYEVWAEGAKGFTCDAIEERDNGEMMCINTLRLMQNLFENSAAQSRFIQSTADPEKDEAILRRSYAGLGGLRGKRILLLGDSVDCFTIDGFGDALPTSSRVVIRPETGEIIPLRPDWTTRFFNIRLAGGKSSIPTSNYSMSDPLHPDDFRLDFIFTFGIGHFGTTEKFFERLVQLERVLSKDIKYDLIVINSGLWDIKRLQELHPGLDLAVGLPPSILGDYIPLYVSVIRQIRERYGADVPIALRPTHSVHSRHVEPRYDPLRFEHFRQAQLEVAHRASALPLPFARLMRHQAPYYLNDGYHPALAANQMHLETVLRLVEESK